MLETLLQAILEQIDEPKKDLEKNLRALLNEAVEKLDLVSKQEIDRQKTALQSANQRLEELQKQISLLEETLKNKK
ncbi:accessory factor UbiK family protein [Acinetobacter pittii]|uniref:accessory factor UbiK family protein n=1 Tax=Acinetobacter pittii TaxID=48296 RepID=UPI00070A5362|nr:accessory factor UbiK family protein [Acinetobacter pittii]KRI51278.1 membrane fusogenic activity [Acinetobacter pittii]